MQPEGQHAGLDMQRIMAFVELKRRYKDLNAQLKSVKEEIKLLEEPMADYLIERGLTGIPLDTGETLYIKEQIFPKFLEGKGREDVIAAMEETGLADDYLKRDYNTRSWQALFKEMVTADEIPAAFSDVVEIGDKHTLQLRGGRKKKG